MNDLSIEITNQFETDDNSLIFNDAGLNILQPPQDTTTIVLDCNTTTTIQVTENIDEEIINLKIDFFSQLFSSLIIVPFKLTEDQENISKSLLIELSELCLEIDKYSLIYTEDKEVQIYKEIDNGYSSLLIDEFGGLTYLVMRKKGYGYICDYFKNEKIDNHVKKSVVKNFSLL